METADGIMDKVAGHRCRACEGHLGDHSREEAVECLTGVSSMVELALEAELEDLKADEWRKKAFQHLNERDVLMEQLKEERAQARVLPYLQLRDPEGYRKPALRSAWKAGAEAMRHRVREELKVRSIPDGFLLAEEAYGAMVSMAIDLRDNAPLETFTGRQLAQLLAEMAERYLRVSIEDMTGRRITDVSRAEVQFGLSKATLAQDDEKRREAARPKVEAPALPSAIKGLGWLKRLTGG